MATHGATGQLQHHARRSAPGWNQVGGESFAAGARFALRRAALAVAVSSNAFLRQQAGGSATIYAGPCGLSDPASDDGDSLPVRASVPVVIDAQTAPAVFDGARFGLAAWAMPSNFVLEVARMRDSFERHPREGGDPVTFAFASVTG
jgi:hypothetical protein